MIYKIILRPFGIILLSSLCLVSCRPISSNVESLHSKGSSVQKMQEKAVISVVDTSEYINATKDYLDSLNRNLSSFKLKKVDVFGSSAEGGEIEIYSKATDTVLLKAVYYGEHGKNEYTYYLRTNNLVSFVNKLTTYKTAIGERAIKNRSEVLTSFVLYNGEIMYGRTNGMIVSKDVYKQEAVDIGDIYSVIKLDSKE